MLASPRVVAPIGASTRSAPAPIALSPARQRALPSLLPEDPATSDRSVTLAWLVLLLVFALDVLIRGGLHLDVLYLFPVLGIALHSREIGPPIVMFVAAICFQAAGLSLHASSVGALAGDAAIASGATALTLALGRAIRARHLAVARLAETDSLTGLGNRRRFEAVAVPAIAGQQRYGGLLSIGILDLDDFKHLNDSRGHAAGDRALVIVADVLRESLRASDSSARLGGDEFAFLLPNTRAKDCRAVCTGLCEEIARRMRAEGLRVTATIGSATFHTAPVSLDHALARADEALYMAKLEGKGRAVSLVATTWGWARPGGADEPAARQALRTTTI
jgi:diguanylate cyclase (GGDEF)-like protein